jgi:lipid A ethanolaminephosphotransferase
LLLYVICNALNAGKLAKWFHGKDGLDLVAFSAYLLAGFCLFTGFFVLVAHRRTIKPVAIVLTLASVAATYFIAKYNVAIDSSMIMNTVRTDSTEVGQLLSVQMIPYLVFLIALPVLAIAKTEITFAERGTYLVASLRIFVLSLCLAVACLYSNYNAILRAGNISNKYIVYSLVPVNVIYSSLNVASRALQPYLLPARAEVPLTVAVSAPEDLVVVLAVGESSRQKSFSLYGYDRRETNPVLKGIGGIHTLNGVARRASTLYALPEIFEKHGWKLPMVVSRAGIPTSCLVNYTLYDNCAALGETKVDHCGHGGKCYDEDVIPLLEARLKAHSPGHEFIVLHLGGGSHGPVYRDRHPPEFLVFKPTCDDADVANRCTVEELHNSYDNAILYVDHVVGGAIRSLDRSGVPYVFIYLSDHGESLMEDGVMFHGMPPGVALPEEQARIPLIVKSSVPISIDARDAYGQPDVFDTVLDLLSIQSPTFDKAGSFISR